MGSLHRRGHRPIPTVHRIAPIIIFCLLYPALSCKKRRPIEENKTAPFHFATVASSKLVRPSEAINQRPTLLSTLSPMWLGPGSGSGP